MYWWARQYLVDDSSEEAEVERTRPLILISGCRRFAPYVLYRTHPFVLGGPGITDKSSFWHKPNVTEWLCYIFDDFSIKFSMLFCIVSVASLWESNQK